MPLADVPDEIWKHVPLEKNAEYGREGGRDTHGGQRSDGPEHPNHYADVDVAPTGTISWRDQCLADPAKLDPEVWRKDFYEQMAKTIVKTDPHRAARLNNEGEQGLLPFRVWQLFDTMVSYLKDRDLIGFLATAGVCAHYVGDASQPLHGSALADGDPSGTSKRWHPKTQQWETVIFGKGVHSAFETDMVATKIKPLIDDIAAGLPKRNHGLKLRRKGKDCALATLELMRDVAQILPPKTILNTYEAALKKADKAKQGNKTQTTMDTMWDDLGQQTAEVMIEGAKTLAMIWDSAWKAGGGDALDATPGQIDTNLLRNYYTNPEFAPSLPLDQIGPILQH